MEKRLELLELTPDVRQLVAECEISGKRTLFERDGKAVAILVSYDEYLALRDPTIHYFRPRPQLDP